MEHFDDEISTDMTYCEEVNKEGPFDRETLLIGESQLEKLKNMRVSVFGVGGVGSFVVEAFARAGIGHIELYDGDVVSVSNINRQLVALHSTIGRYKVEVMEARIRDINPECEVTKHILFVDKTNFESVRLDNQNYVIDAIDMVTTKLMLAENCYKLQVPEISCMGTGNKLHAEMFRITDIYKTSVCPLAKVMRRELKQLGVDKLKVLYSEEVPAKHRPPGSISFVPSVAGMLIAGEAIRDMLD